MINHWNVVVEPLRIKSDSTAIAAVSVRYTTSNSNSESKVKNKGSLFRWRCKGKIKYLSGKKIANKFI